MLQIESDQNHFFLISAVAESRIWSPVMAVTETEPNFRRTLVAGASQAIVLPPSNKCLGLGHRLTSHLQEAGAATAPVCALCSLCCCVLTNDCVEVFSIRICSTSAPWYLTAYRTSASATTCTWSLRLACTSYSHGCFSPAGPDLTQKRLVGRKTS